MLKDEILDNYISIIFRKYLGKWDYIDVRSVSYTHLTLPTN